ncbi:MAG TPA: helix-turn-helix domain-containing protein [Acidimicrobiales bacterium]
MTAGAQAPATGPRRRGRPPAQRSEETHAAILRAARVCFSKRGYAGTSVAQIAHEAGLTSRAVYHYVDSKPALFADAVAGAHRRVGEEIMSRVAGRRGPRAALRAWIEAFLVLFEEDPSLVQFLGLAVVEAERNPELIDALPDRDAGLSALNHWFVERAVHYGEFAPGVDPDGVITLLEVFAAGLSLLASDGRERDHRAMLDVLGRLAAGHLFTDRREDGAAPG